MATGLCSGGHMPSSFRLVVIAVVAAQVRLTATSVAVIMTAATVTVAVVVTAVVNTVTVPFAQQ